MELHKAIKTIVNQFGKDIIAEKRFVYMIADYYSYRDNLAVQRVLTALVNGGYMARLLGNRTDNELSLIKDTVVKGVSDNYGFKEDLVEDVVITIIEGIGGHVRKTNNMPPQKTTLFSQSQSCQTYSASPSNQTTNKNQNTVVEKEYYLKSYSTQKTYDAKGIYNFSNGSFKILVGSLLAHQNFNTYWLTKDDIFRKKIISTYCHDNTQHFIVTSDIYCSSPNEAVLVVTGQTAIGLITWKDNNGKSIYEDPRFRSVKYEKRSERLF